MKNPHSHIKSQLLLFVVCFLLLAALFALLQFSVWQIVSNALFFSVLIVLVMRRHHRPLDCGEHEHQQRLCIRNLKLVVECSVCHQRWHLKEPRPAHMTLAWGILSVVCWGILKHLEISGVMSTVVANLLMLVTTLLMLLLVDVVYFLLLRRKDLADLAGAEFDKDI